MKQIATALLKAKREFGPALKEKNNPAFKSKYADLMACFDAVDKPCLDAGIVLYQETSEDSTGVTVETVFLHESGEHLRCGKLHVPASKQDPQGYGSALTYARRYSLLTACGMAPEDDDGNAAAKPQPNQQRAKEEVESLDMSPKARAARIMTGVAAGDTVNAAKALAGLEQSLRDEIWVHISEPYQTKLTAAWPKE